MMRVFALLTAFATLTSACATAADSTTPKNPKSAATSHPPSQVKPLDFGGKLPAGAEVRGTFHKAIGWHDRHGRNAIVMGIKQTATGDGATTLLTADHLRWGGSSWTLQRRFQQLVEACPYDTTLQAKVGDWSVTDIDRDGLGEATFAWSWGCRSDVSAVGHKVLLVTRSHNAVVKYVLRGDTALDDGNGEVVGGEFEADPAFDRAPEGFLEHAMHVWESTALETM